MVDVVPLTPPINPVTTPVPAPTPALPLLLVQFPPAGVVFNVVAKPTHTANPGVAVIGKGVVLIVTIAVMIQPVDKVYVTTSVPAATPVTTPVLEPTVALPLLRLQVPPAGVEFNVIVYPIHTGVLPVIAVGFGLMVTVLVVIQPVGSV